MFTCFPSRILAVAYSLCTLSYPVSISSITLISRPRLSRSYTPSCFCPLRLSRSAPIIAYGARRTVSCAAVLFHTRWLSPTSLLLSLIIHHTTSASPTGLFDFPILLPLHSGCLLSPSLSAYSPISLVLQASGHRRHSPAPAPAFSQLSRLKPDCVWALRYSGIYDVH